MTVASTGVPKIRFPQFSGDWVAKRGSDAFDQRRERGEDGLPLYAVTIDRGMVRRDSLDREISSALSDEGNLRVRKDDLAYNMMRMWQGAVGRAAEDGMVSPAYVVLSPKADTAPAFFEHWFKRSRSLYLLWAYSYGLTNDRLRLYFRDFAKVPMALPSRNEQQKIAEFLGSVDERIALLTRKAEALTHYKRKVAHSLFTRELRFRRDDGADFPDWNNIHLRDVATFAKGRGISKDDVSANGDTPCIRYGELYTAYGERIYDIFSRTNVPVKQLLLSKSGDVILPASGEVPLDMASASYIPMAGVAIGGDINVIRSSLHGLFLAYLLRGPVRRSVARLAQGNAVVHLYSSHLAGLALSVPSDFEEQRRIADFLSALDDKINAVRTKITSMQILKKGLLQKMFV